MQIGLPKFIRQSIQVTRHDLIFSDQRRIRIARHVAFWLVWCVSYNLLFHFPIHVFKGWDTTGPGTVNLQKLGVPMFFIKTLLVNSLFGVIIPQIAFTYFLIYWLIPNYFYKKKNVFVTISVISGALLVFYILALGFKQSPGIYNRMTGMRPTYPPGFMFLNKVVVTDQLTTLPIVMGFALMIKLFKRCWLKQKETEQLAREKVKAELQLLKAQIHPHFLFNTLNNIYFFALSGSLKAPEMIKKLYGLLHYILNECNQPLVPLEKEINMIQDYISLEKIRYGEQTTLTVELPQNYTNKLITPLLLIPFVENSFKHGASKMLDHPYVKLRISIEDNILHFFITNSRPQTTEPTSAKGNIGLKNVKKRLELIYPAAHELTVIPEPGNFTVYLKIQLQNMDIPSGDKEEIKTIEYALA